MNDDTTLADNIRDAAEDAGLGGSHFAASEAAKRRPLPAPVTPPDTGTGAALDRETVRRNAIRDALLAQARQNYPAIMNSVQTGYSTYLQSLQQRVNADLRAEGNRFHSQAVILDPAKFDAGMAIGLNGTDSVNAQLQPQGAVTPPGVPQQAAAQMSTFFPMPSGSSTYTQSPTALQNPGLAAPQACVVIPSSEYAMTDDVNIPGVSTADRIKFLDRHETWHCRDDRFSMNGIDQTQARKVNISDPSTIANNAEACKVLAVQYQKEAFADTGAIGSMLREGYDMSLLDKVAEWRKDRPADTLHITTPVLEGLKKEIQDMGGIDKFRALNDAQAKDLYYKTVEKYGVNGAGVQAGLKYALANPLQTVGHQIDAIFDRDSSKGIDFYHYFSAKAIPAKVTTLTSDQQRQLDGFNPQASMEEQAFSLGGKVTPETMIRAYTQMQDEFRTLIKQHPDNPLYTQEMAKMQRDFTQNLHTMDYVAANQRFGVKIENVEPTLAAFSAGQQRPGAPKTVPPAIKP